MPTTNHTIPRTFNEFDPVLVDGDRPGYIIDKASVCWRVHLVDDDVIALFHPSRIESAGASSYTQRARQYQRAA